MAVTVYKNAFFSYDSVDLSDHVVSLEVPYDIEKLDSTAMGSDTKHSEPGLFDHPVKVTLLQDFAASKVDQTIGTDAATVPPTKVTIVIRPDSGAAAATNPSYTFTAWCSSYQPLKGSVGELQQVDIELAISSGDITRAEA